MIGDIKWRKKKKADDCHTDEKPHKLDEGSYLTITITYALMFRINQIAGFHRNRHLMIFRRAVLGSWHQKQNIFKDFRQAFFHCAIEEKRHMAVQWRVFLPTDCLTLLMSPSKELWRHWRQCSSLRSYDRWLIVTLFGLLPAGLKKEVKTGSIRILTAIHYTKRSTRDRCDRAVSAHACWDLCVIVRISSASH